MSSGESVLVSANNGLAAPDGFPARSAEHDHLLAIDVELATEESDIDAATRRYLTASTESDLISIQDDFIGPSANLVEQIRELEDATNALYKSVLMDAPALSFHCDLGGLEPQSSWMVDSEQTWLEPSIGVGQLSTAQRRWAEWAINTAVNDETTVPDAGKVILSIIDEPEMALHRAAEARMALALSRFADGEGHALLVASHSPEVLNSPSANVVEVRRSVLSLLDPADKRSMANLGLLPSDLLRRQRAFLLVEGLHDTLVLDTLLGDELRRLRVEMLPLRGAKQLSAIKSRFLFTFTDAQLIVMLDNLNTEAVSSAWAETKERFVVDGVTAAQRVLNEAFRGPDIEQRSLREFLGACIEDDQIDRVTPHGLSFRDIIEYLPVEAFVSDQATWAELRAQHEAARKVSAKVRDFKNWLAKAHGVDFSDASIVAAANRLDSIPPDFVRLLKTIEAVTTDAAERDGSSL